MESTFTLRVIDREIEADNVISLYLASPTGEALPAWAPGSHLDFILPSGLVRQYSLNGDCADRYRYRIGVLLSPDTRGGSKEVHELPIGGVELKARGPVNQFPLQDANGYIFLAGGIGITPILPMLKEAERLQKPWRLIYGAKTRSSLAYADEISSGTYGSVDFVPQDEQGFPDFESIFKTVGAEDLVYACGPAPMLDVLEKFAGSHLLPGQFKIERFGLSESNDLLYENNQTFECELRKTGVVLTVPPDRSLLEMVLEVDPTYLWACEEGYCGTCITPVLEGVPEHRDTCLTDEERDSNTLMTLCVSRAITSKLVLDV